MTPWLYAMPSDAERRKRAKQMMQRAERRGDKACAKLWRRELKELKELKKSNKRETETQ